MHKVNAEILKIMAIKTFVSSPEDTILAKLSSGSEKQMNDARGILAVQAQQLDFKIMFDGQTNLNFQNSGRQLTPTVVNTAQKNNEFHFLAPADPRNES